MSGDRPAASARASDGPAGARGSRVGRRGPAFADGGRPADDRTYVREGRERAWRFFRGVVGLFLLTWLVVSFLSADLGPALSLPTVSVFLIGLVPLWVASVPVAWYLVYRDGYRRLRDSDWYDPNVPAGRALSAFVVVSVVLKVALTLLADVLIGSRPYVADLGVSLIVLGVAYGVIVSGLAAPE